MDAQETREFQRREALISQVYGTFPIPVVNGNTQSDQSQAIREIQKLLGLPPTGTVDEPTRDGIVRLSEELHRYYQRGRAISVYPGNREFRAGDRHELIGLVKQMLRSLSGRYRNIPAPNSDSPDLDAQTVAALKTLQQCCGMGPNGVLNKETWNRLAALYEQHIERQGR